MINMFCLEPVEITIQHGNQHGIPSHFKHIHIYHNLNNTTILDRKADVTVHAGTQRELSMEQSPAGRSDHKLNYPIIQIVALHEAILINHNLQLPKMANTRNPLSQITLALDSIGCKKNLNNNWQQNTCDTDRCIKHIKNDAFYHRRWRHSYNSQRNGDMHPID